MRSGSDHARNRLQKAIDKAREYGLFGHNIYSSGYNLDIVISKEPGRSFCGEETALINTLEGKRGMPQLKPPYPTTSGYWKTNSNKQCRDSNKCSSYYAERTGMVQVDGTENSPGTKVLQWPAKAVCRVLLKLKWELL